jgi:hypothetical protein
MSISSEYFRSSDWAVAHISIFKRSSSLNFLKKLLVFHKIRLTIAKAMVSKKKLEVFFLGLKSIQLVCCFKDNAK